MSANGENSKSHCHICGFVITSTYADTCDRCAADPSAAYAEQQIADNAQFASAAAVEVW